MRSVSIFDQTIGHCLPGNIKCINCIFTLALAGMIFLQNGTISFSELIIPTTSWSSVNSSLAIPSKHFFRWGCTRSGSLVSDRISSSSSFDKKKNLKNTGTILFTIQKTLAQVYSNLSKWLRVFIQHDTNMPEAAEHERRIRETRS